MQGIELIKNLAELDRELAEKVEETRQSVEHRIKSAEAESQRLLAEAEAQIRQMEEASATRIAEESARHCRGRPRPSGSGERTHSQSGYPEPRSGPGIHSYRGHAVIARMEKLFIVASKRLAPKLLFMLQQAGVVQVDPLPKNEMGAYPLEPVQETRLRRWEAVALAAKHASGLLGLEFDAWVDPYQGDLQKAEVTALSYERQAAMLVEKRERLIDELQLIEQYQGGSGVSGGSRARSGR